MVRLALFAMLAPVLAGYVSAAPIASRSVFRRAFAAQDYASFQISDGVAGNAQAEANAVFVDPFNGVDLATVGADAATVESMRKLAEAAETDQFNPAIAAATGADATALQNGKIKNKVLKLTGETQAIKIKLAVAQAAGDDTSDLETKLATEQKKLDTNIATDKKNTGAASKGVVGSSSSSASNTEAAAASTSLASTKAAAASSTTSSAAATETNAAAAASGAVFTAKAYPDFQISDGVAGNAEAEANAVFVDPFAGVDLATVGDAADTVESMRKLAEAAETDQFNPAIDAATGADADALSNGKIKNKVLKLTGEVQAIKIKMAVAQAAGGDTSSLQTKLTEEQTKLDKNIATDKKNAGAVSKGVV
ncbi:hypothetical protein HETIRDRAFT_482290 [Heterobasidion irregulare TC 32-1]|uniref:Small secreted protein n=1 Tax=Heterobasidion irregulare (strain TC 32-1) TaxID=747525 RepID=W4JRQ5_HETIT|nr:uncharacterized protein HETIRDRAFT_482290 [Heterobasidion irregulare TC 32-1]ETW75556.1 hypothetical protein HETIRDRAFT_482290 [Heterobasidion irregulare TC 32-1]